jgi:outer membrane protein assembly factor BamE (lipoprotein component of BamABCDE complex)
MGRILHLNPSKRILCVAILGAVLVACSPRVATRGNLADEEKLSQIDRGRHGHLEVTEILGSPSSTAVFDTEVWHYISQRTETFAFFEPKVSERRVVIIKFDPQGKVSEIKTLSLEEGRQIEPVDRVTRTEGKRLSFLEQILGNFVK